MNSLPHVVRRVHALATPAPADPILVQAFLSRRDEAAFAELVRRHGPMVYSVCRRWLGDAHAADDAFQATFLLLARKASAVRGEKSVAPWLYGAACRIAWRARRSWRRRRLHESRAVAPAGSAAPDAAWEELRLLLDEELNRLPDRLRVPLILCYLQGRTRDEAAQQLGCSFGALKRRLEDGRTLLRNRLARRGVALALTGFSAAVSESPLTAALVEQTLRLVGGSPVPATVSALLPGAIMGRWKVLVAAALVGTLLTGTALTIGAIRSRPPAEAARALPTAEPPKQPEVKRDWFNDRLPEGAVARLGTTAFRHGDDWVYDIAHSADARQVLSLSSSLVCVWEAKTGQLLAEFPRPEGKGTWVGGAFVGDGKSVCLVHDDGLARVYDVATRGETRSFDLAGEQPRRTQTLKVAFTPDGAALAVLETDDTIRLWDVGAGHCGRLLAIGGKVIRAFAHAAGVKSLAALDEDNNVRVWSLATGQELSKFSCAGRDVRFFACSRDGNWVATVGQTTTHHDDGQFKYSTSITDSYVELWDVSKGRLARQIEAHPKGIGAIRFAPDCRSIVTGGFGLDPFVRRWDLKMGKNLLELPRHGNAVAGLDVSGDCKSLATSTTGIVRLWDPETGKETLPIDAHRTAVSKIVLLPNGRALTGGGEGDLREWDLMTGKPLGRIEAQRGYIGDFARSADGRCIAVLSFSHENPEVHLFDATGKRVRTLKGKKHAVGCLAFSPDGTLLAGADYGGNVLLWEVESGRELRTLKAAGTRGVDRLAFTADGKQLFGASIDDPFCIWDVASGELKQSWDPFKLGLMKRGAQPNEAERAMGLAFSRDRRFVALGIQGQPRLLICDVETGKLVKSIDRLPGTPVSIAFSPDGKTIAWGTWEGPVHLCDRESNAKLTQFTGHRGRVLSLVFTPDSRHLVSCSEDSTALVWAVPK